MISELREIANERLTMEPEQSYEFRCLRDDVVQKMRHHTYVDAATHVFQYLVLPAFTPTIAWDVFRRPRLGHSDDFILVRTTWRSDLDSEKVRTPVERLRHSRPLQPTIELNLLSVPSAELEQLSKELAELKLPIGAASHSYGIDGTFYEIAIDQSSVYSSSAKCRLSWWHTPPAQWPGVLEWIKRAAIIFDASAQSVPSIPLRIRPIDDTASKE
ncbi:MAG: hypothetical protein JNN26_19360 [Candidatus Obscuribacter sp.]|nr:hypothetical protein [Candidatus Obscuribacter sp.]